MLLAISALSIACDGGGGGGDSSSPVALPVLTITPASGVTYFSMEDGEGFLDENTDGSTEKLLGTIIDNIVTSAVVSYRLANATDSNDNGDFRINTATGQIYYTGSVLDFESLTDKKQFILDVIRTLDGNVATDQTLQYVINLRNLNDTAPDLTAYLPLVEGATEKAEIAEYIAVGNVGGGNYAIVIDVKEKDHQVTFDFRYVDDDTSDFVPRVMIEAEYETANDPNSKVTKFIITTRLATYDTIGTVLDDTSNTLVTATSNADALSAWNDYVKSVKFVGSATLTPAESDSLYSSDVSLTGTYKGIVVERGNYTTGTIVDFDDNDPDGASFTYSYNVTDTVTSSGDADAFNINGDGELSFKTPPTADNTYTVTITVSDGTNSDTYDLQIVVVP